MRRGPRGGGGAPPYGGRGGGAGGGGGAQPYEGCCVPPLWPIRPETPSGTPETPFGHPPISRCSPVHFRTPITLILYINLRPRTIPETLVTSGISSGTPNNLR